MIPSKCLKDRQFLSYRWSYYLKHPLDLIFEWGRWIKWFFQRGWRGWADCDGWNIDGYLLSWLPDAIEQMAKYKTGHPCEETTESWQEKLDKMVDGFRAAQTLNNLDYDFKDKDAENALIARKAQAMKLFCDHFDSLWD